MNIIKSSLASYFIFEISRTFNFGKFDPLVNSSLRKTHTEIQQIKKVTFHKNLCML
jgi:hypothetical protein